MVLNALSVLTSNNGKITPCEFSAPPHAAHCCFHQFLTGFELACVNTHEILSSLCCRQWDEEEKARHPKTDTLAEQTGMDLENDDDDVSTVGGVLHEEDFTETKAGPGQYDVEAPHGSSQEETGLLAVLKIVDWWKVRSNCALQSVRCFQPGLHACHTAQHITTAVQATPAIAMSHHSVNCAFEQEGKAWAKSSRTVVDAQSPTSGLGISIGSVDAMAYLACFRSAPAV